MHGGRVINFIAPTYELEFLIVIQFLKPGIPSHVYCIVVYTNFCMVVS